MVPIHWLATCPKNLELNNHVLKPLTPWPQINFSLCKLITSSICYSIGKLVNTKKKRNKENLRELMLCGCFLLVKTFSPRGRLLKTQIKQNFCIRKFLKLTGFLKPLSRVIQPVKILEREDSDQPSYPTWHAWSSKDLAVIHHGPQWGRAFESPKLL